MLNLTDMFTAQPYKVEGGRIIKGRAMSGSKESVSTTMAPKAPPKVTAPKPEPKATTQTPRKIYTLVAIRRMYEPVMKGKGWMSSKMVSELVGGTSERSLHHLRKLLLTTPPTVEMKRTTIKGKANMVRFMWRWKS